MVMLGRNDGVAVWLCLAWHGLLYVYSFLRYRFRTWTTTTWTTILFYRFLISFTLTIYKDISFHKYARALIKLNVKFHAQSLIFIKHTRSVFMSSRCKFYLCKRFTPSHYPPGSYSKQLSRFQNLDNSRLDYSSSSSSSSKIRRGSCRRAVFPKHVNRNSSTLL